MKWSVEGSTWLGKYDQTIQTNRGPAFAKRQENAYNLPPL